MASTINAKNTSTGVVITPDASGQLELQTADTTRMTIDVNGNVGVGTTSIPAACRIALVGGAICFGSSGQQTVQSISDDFGIGGNLTFAGGSSGFRWVNSGNSVQIMKIDSSNNVLVTTPSGLGYGTGAGGTVTQGTSRTTAVTINKPTGQITMFTAAGSASWQNFTVNNSLVASTDTVTITYTGGSNSYIMVPFKVSAGSFSVWFFSITGTATDTPVINFSIIKGATS